MAEEIGLIALFDIAQFQRGLAAYTVGLDFVVNAVADATKEMAGALFDLGKESFTLAVDFESAMTELSIAAGKTGPSFGDLKEAALAVGGASNLVGVSASDAAEAMTSLFKAGLTTEQVLGDLNATMEDGNNVTGALRASIDLAAASSLDMTQAADLASKVLGIFGADAVAAGKDVDTWIVEAMNNLVQAADASVAEVEGLAEALKFVGPTAAQAGLSLEDTNTALAILSKSGIEASMAGTNLRAMLNSLLAPTDQASGELKKLGVSMFDASGAARPFEDVMRDLSKALFGVNEVTTEVGGRTKEQNQLLKDAEKAYANASKKVRLHTDGLKILSDKALANANAEMINAQNIIAELSGIQGEAVKTTRQLTDAQREEAINTIFTANGAASLKAILAEVNQTNEDGVDGWEAMVQAIAGAATMQEIAEAKAKTFAGRLEALGGVAETLKISMGDKLLPVASDLIGAFTVFIETVGPGVIDAFGGLVAPIGSLVAPLGRVAETFSRLISPQAEESLEGLPDKMALVAGASDVVIDRGEDFRLALVNFGVPREVIDSIEEFADFAPKIFELASAFGSLLSGLIVGDLDFSTLADIRQLVGEAFGADASGMLSKFVLAFLDIREAVLDFANTARPKIAAIAESLTLMIDSVGSGIARFVGFLLAGDLSTALEGLEDGLSGAFGSDVGAMITSFVETIIKIAAAISEVVDIARPKIDVIAKAFGVMYNLVGEKIIPQLVKLMETLGVTVGDSGDAWGFLKNIIEIEFIAIEAVVIAVMAFITAALSAIIGFFQGFAEELDWIIAGAQATISGISDAFSSVVGIIANVIKGDFRAAMADGGKFLDALAKVFAGFRVFVTGVWNGLMKGIIKGTLEFVNTVIKFISDMVDELVGNSIIPDMVNSIIEWFQTLLDTGSKLIDDLRYFIESTWQAILDAIPMWWGQITAALDTAIRAISGAVSGAVDTVIEVGLKIVERIKKGIEDTWSTIVSAVDTSIRALVAGVADAVATLIEIGKEMVRKIGKGISDTWGAVVNSVLQNSIKALELAGDTVQALKDFGAEMVNKIGAGLSGAWGVVTGTLNSLIEGGIDLGAAALNALAGIGRAIIETISAAISSDKGLAGALFEAVKGAINNLIDEINSFIQDTIAPLIPGVELPMIPNFEAGVLNFSGGAAIVGESGPELVTLPRGSNVIPFNSPIGALSTTINNVSNQIFNLNLSGDFSSGNVATDAVGALRELQVAAALRR